jgi:hypothetical protein
VTTSVASVFMRIADHIKLGSAPGTTSILEDLDESVPREHNLDSDGKYNLGTGALTPPTGILAEPV